VRLRTPPLHRRWTPHCHTRRSIGFVARRS
jgi:hypothetical protein